MLGSEGSSFTEYAIETCYGRPAGAQPPFESPFASDPVPLDTTVGRGDVFLCTIRTEPPADVGDLGLIILDNLGTTAAWGGSDYPASAPSSTRWAEPTAGSGPTTSEPASSTATSTS